jgi:Tfp pilus assembly protein PilP
MVAAAVRTELKPVAVRTAPITLRQPSNPLSVLKVTAFQAAPPKLPVATVPKEPKTGEKQAYVETVAAPTHTLEGLLELGDKSAALFKVDGVTRRIDVGESIGSSGWTLVEVSKGEAVVRRNGEVRSIYTGQNL